MSERSISPRNETNSAQEPIGEMPSDIIVLDNTEKPQNSDKITTAESNEKSGEDPTEFGSQGISGSEFQEIFGGPIYEERVLAPKIIPDLASM